MLDAPCCCPGACCPLIPGGLAFPEGLASAPDDPRCSAVCASAAGTGGVPPAPAGSCGRGDSCSGPGDPDPLSAPLPPAELSSCRVPLPDPPRTYAPQHCSQLPASLALQ